MLRKFVYWVTTGKTQPPTRTVFDSAHEDDPPKSEYSIQIKEDLLTNEWNWRLVKSGNWKSPYGLRTSGTSRSERGAIEAAERAIGKLDKHEANKAQEWKTV